jgi:hypothetical protein
MLGIGNISISRSARFLWYCESGVDVFFPDGIIFAGEELEFPDIGRLHLGD